MEVEEGLDLMHLHQKVKRILLVVLLVRGSSTSIAGGDDYDASSCSWSSTCYDTSSCSSCSWSSLSIAGGDNDSSCSSCYWSSTYYDTSSCSSSSWRY